MDDAGADGRDFLVLEGLFKSFGEHRVLEDFGLSVRRGEIVALLGPSGSGKTTVLRLLAGFERPDRGRIVVDGEEVQELPAARRGFGMVFQSYALFPHLSVARNVAFGLEVLRLGREEIAQRVTSALELVELAGLEERRVSEISGGQQQRVALARALAPRPRVLMLDEPLSNLDPALRERTRGVLRSVLKETGITTVLVTHEQEEAFDLGEHVGVLHDGRLEQLGVPEELYQRAATRFVASFVGRTSELRGVYELAAGDARVELSSQPEVSWTVEAKPELVTGQPVDLVVRPEELCFVGEEGNGLPGEVCDRRYTGAFSFYRVRLERGGEIELLEGSRAVEPGDRVRVALRDAARPSIFAIDAESDGAQHP